MARGCRVRDAVVLGLLLTFASSVDASGKSRARRKELPTPAPFQAQTTAQAQQIQAALSRAGLGPLATGYEAVAAPSNFGTGPSLVLNFPPPPPDDVVEVLTSLKDSFTAGLETPNATEDLVQPALSLPSPPPPTPPKHTIGFLLAESAWIVALLVTTSGLAAIAAFLYVRGKADEKQEKLSSDKQLKVLLPTWLKEREATCLMSRDKARKEAEEGDFAKFLESRASQVRDPEAERMNLERLSSAQQTVSKIQDRISLQRKKDAIRNVTWMGKNPAPK